MEVKVTSIAKGTFICSRDTLEEAQKARKELVRALPKVSKGNEFELLCEPYEGVWAVFMYKNLTIRVIAACEQLMTYQGNSPYSFECC